MKSLFLAIFTTLVSTSCFAYDFNCGLNTAFDNGGIQSMSKESPEDCLKSAIKATDSYERPTTMKATYTDEVSKKVFTIKATVKAKEY
jgi:hypothetical protein